MTALLVTIGVSALLGLVACCLGVVIAEIGESCGIVQTRREDGA